MVVIINFLFLFIRIAISKKQTLLESPIVIQSNLWYLSMKLGSNSKEIYEKISQSQEFTWLTSSVFREALPKSSKTISQTTILFNDEELIGKVVVDQLDFPKSNQILSDFYFKYNNESNKNYHHGWFGFAYKFNDEKYSIIHQLYKSKLINHLSYAIAPNPDKSNGTFYFGGIPPTLIQSKYSSTCLINVGFSSWGCILSYVIMGRNKKYKTTNADNAFFAADEKEIIAPEDFMLYLNNTVWIDYIVNRDCRYESMRKDSKYFICSCDVVPYLPDIQFVFGSSNFSFSLPNLFDEYDQFCIFQITSKENHNKWVFGKIFLENYYSLFDYEQKAITFYSDYKFNSNANVSSVNNKQLIKRVIEIAMVMSLFGLGFLLYLKRGFNKIQYDLLLEFKSKDYEVS